ncbi:protein phosphatase 2C domain-containing protein [Streptomyces incarnatus]|uniref:protein phosphatase 2C domain-containing protein n=1 Tax=Streptomyces incarnatus TaxID=665007 RepID=UPI001AD8370A|nr:protein phosphatase 2C domain-containing protein [Streptomyces incarnatus]
MSQQGGRPARPEDDWWGQLYDDSTEDTGPTAAPDSLDDRFASAKRTVTGRPVPAPTSDRAPGAGGAPRDDTGSARGSGAVLGAGGAGGAEGAGGSEWRGAAVPTQRTAQDPPSAPPVQPPPVTPAAQPAAPDTATGTPPRPRSPWEPPSSLPSTGRPPEPSTTPPESTAPPSPAAPTSPTPSAPPTPNHPAHTLPTPPPEGPTQDAQAPASPTTPTEPPTSRPPQDPPTPPSPPSAEPRGLPTPAATGSASVPAPAPAPDPAPAPSVSPSPPAPSAVDYVGSGPPTYDPEPTALPDADPDGLGELGADTVLDGARYGACTLRAVSMRGDSARFRGEPRRDSLLTARFGTGRQALVLVAMATGVRGTPVAHLAASEACRWIGRAVGRSHHRLVEDIRAARRGDLKSGLHRLTDRSLGKLRASAAEQGVDPEQYTASLRCLLLPADPDCRTRVFFGVGDGGLFRLRDGAWQDIEPKVTAEGTAGAPVVGFGSPPPETPEGDRLTMDFGIPTPPSPYEPAPEPPREPFRFRTSVARPGDALVMCTAGLADPLRGEAALCAYLARRWSGRTPPGLAAFLADAQVRVKGYADDRTAAAVWEA